MSRQPIDAVFPLPDFEARLLAGLPAPRRARSWMMGAWFSWRPAMVMGAAALVAGFWVGGLYFDSYAATAAAEGDFLQSALLIDAES